MNSIGCQISILLTKNVIIIPVRNKLTQCSLMTPYGDMNLVNIVDICLDYALLPEHITPQFTNSISTQKMNLYRCQAECPRQ